VIGRGNQIPWRCRKISSTFQAATLGHVLIMGRRTFESLAAAARRTTIVISHPDYAPRLLLADSVDTPWPGPPREPG
jgi:dihydrofolate reductase